MTTAEMSTRSCQFCGVAVRTSEYGEHLTSFHHINLTSGGPDNTEKVKYYREISLTPFSIMFVLQCMFCLERVAAVELPGHVFYHHHISGLYLNTGAAGSCAETVARGAQTEDTDTEEDTLSMQLDTIIPGDDDYQSARIPSPCSHHDDTATASKDDHTDEDTPITLPIVETIDSSKTEKNLPLQTVIERNDSGDASVRSSDVNVIVHDEERSNNSVPTSAKTDDVESTRSEQLHDSCEDDDNDEDSDESDFEMDTCEYKIYNCECNFCKSKEVEGDEVEACDDDLTIVDETIPSPAETPVTGCDGSVEKQLPDLPHDDTHQNTEPKKKKKKVTFADITNYYPVKKPGWLERLHRSRGRGQGSGGQQQQILGPNTSLKYLRYWGTPNKPPSEGTADAELKLERRRKPRPSEAAKSRNTGSVSGVSVRVNLAEDGETSLRSLGVVWRCPRPGCLFAGDSVKVVRQHFAKHK